MSTRRGFLASILAAGYAPAAIGSGILMPVRKIALPLSRESDFYDADAWDVSRIDRGPTLPFDGGPRTVIVMPGDTLRINVWHQGRKYTREHLHTGEARVFTSVQRDPATGLWLPV